MESSIETKNILILLSLFLLGFLVGITISNIEKENIDLLLSQLRKESTLDIQIEEVEEVKEVVVVEEEEEIDPCPVRVDIAGAVKNPGVYCLEKDSAVIDVIRKAGGLIPSVAYKYLGMKVNLATLLTDNSKIYIPFEEDSICELLQFKLPKDVTNITEPKPPEEQENTQNECISINSATLEELDSLDGVGPSTAQKIIDGRPYEVLEDLLNVSGIGEATFEKFKDQICL